MSLTYRQKNTLKAIIVLLCAGCVLAGIIILVMWADTTDLIQKYCSGSTLITITTDHGGDTSVIVKDHGC